jgi:hypothetical protein
LTFITKVDFFSNDDELKNKKGNKQWMNVVNKLMSRHSKK